MHEVASQSRTTNNIHEIATHTFFEQRGHIVPHSSRDIWKIGFDTETTIWPFVEFLQQFLQSRTVQQPLLYSLQKMPVKILRFFLTLTFIFAFALPVSRALLCPLLVYRAKFLRQVLIESNGPYCFPCEFFQTNGLHSHQPTWKGRYIK